MKKQILFLVAIVLLCGFYSCSDDDGDLPNDESYLEITVNGETYDTDNGGIMGFADQETCDDKDGFLMMVGQIEASPEFFFEFDLKHYENFVDFSTVETGTGSIRSSRFGQSCNFDAFAEFDDNTEANENTRLKSGGVNNVTSIKKLSENSTDVDYAIQGNFNCVFINDSDEEISVSGKYNVITYVLK